MALVLGKDCSWRKGSFLAGESGLGMALLGVLLFAIGRRRLL